MRPTSCSSTRRAPAFRRIAGKDKEKAFYGVDQDIHAFTEFITQFLTKYGRWNSPKYVFGESYGTMRGAGLALALQNADVDLNGVILLSDILNWDFMPDDPQLNPGIDMPYVVALPTYAATAWYFDKVPNKPADLRASSPRSSISPPTDYAQALIKGNDLPDARAAADRAAALGLHRPVRALSAQDQPADRIWRVPEGAARRRGADHRHARHALRRRDARSAEQGRELRPAGLGDRRGLCRRVAQLRPRPAALRRPASQFKSGIPIYSKWDYKHQPPGADKPLIMLPNVLPDLATAMKQNPDMKVMVNGGYFDVSTPYFEGVMEMRHLPVPPACASNIEYHYYQSGHMVYVRPATLGELHANVADFIRRTSGVR